MAVIMTIFKKSAPGKHCCLASTEVTKMTSQEDKATPSTILGECTSTTGKYKVRYNSAHRFSNSCNLLAPY